MSRDLLVGTLAFRDLIWLLSPLPRGTGPAKARSQSPCWELAVQGKFVDPSPSPSLWTQLPSEVLRKKSTAPAVGSASERKKRSRPSSWGSSPPGSSGSGRSDSAGQCVCHGHDETAARAGQLDPLHCGAQSPGPWMITIQRRLGAASAGVL